MNERDAINALCRDRCRPHLCVPRYTPRGWWECDLFEVTASGMFREYEVKLTVADFRADAQKRNVKIVAPWDLPNGSGRACEWPSETKHGLLIQGSPRGPARFWYVTPQGLLRPEMLPAWAGLIELETVPANTRRYTERRAYIHEWEIVKAPTLHRQKLDPKITEHARGVCYYRMHDLMQRQSVSAVTQEEVPA